MSKDDFFIGWESETPARDRRTFLAAGLTLSAAALAGGAGIAKLQSAPGAGTWDQGNVRSFTGVATAYPYASLRTRDVDGQERTVFLSCLGKCGVTTRISSYAGQAVTVQGTLIQRGKHAMISVIDGIDWIMPNPSVEVTEQNPPAIEARGQVNLSGLIIDTKCWFGAMRPSEGKVHKGCASLCIRGGIPPALLTKDAKGRSRLLIMTEQDQAFGEGILPFVADPVRVAGELRSRGGVLFLDSTSAQIKRI